MVWARILLLFGCFGSVRQRLSKLETLALYSAFRGQRFGSFSSCCVAWLGHESCCCSGVSQALFFYLLCNVSALFLPAVSHGLGTNLAAGDSSFLVRSVGNVSAVFQAAVSHGLGTNPAAVRVFRTRFAKGFRSWKNV